jgi:adhesin transport system outer membrane protein
VGNVNWLILTSVLTAGGALAGEPFTISDAINQAVQTHPAIGEAAANRRATEAELRQNQSTLLPQVRLEAKYGRERFSELDIIPPPLGNNAWLKGSQGSVVVRQLVFDGLQTLNQIWRQAARVDAAAFRVRERTELIALDTAEAYIDVVRYTRLISIAQENVAAHQKILSNVDARFKGGRAGEGDLQQVQERVESSAATSSQFRQSYEEAKAAFRKTVGIEPYNLRVPGRLHGLPTSRDASLEVTLQYNPTIRAAEADKDAAKYDFQSTGSAFTPTVALEGRAVRGNNVDTIFGRQSDLSGFVVASWDIFRGGQDSWKRAEAAERYQEQTMRHASFQRDAFESIDKAWSARTVTSDRIAALTREIAADRKVIDSYQKEYELGQRSLIDLLNAQNGLFNALVSLESARGVAVFADYQLLAAMGQLIDYMKTPRPVDAVALETKPYGLIPTRLPPVLLTLPEADPKPLNFSGRAGAEYAIATGQIAPEWTADYLGNPKTATSSAGLFAWPASVSNAYAAPGSGPKMPPWPIASTGKH